MKKKITIWMLAAALFALAVAGCGDRDQTGAGDSGTNGEDAENFAADQTGAQAAGDTEGSSQLQLGSAVEIPSNFRGELAETGAHGELERAIAQYFNISEKDYANVRYYYNYVDLNGDGKNEILALALGQKVAGLDGNALLWLQEADGSCSVRQAFRQVGVPVYVSNHMTGGYRDLILTDRGNAVGKEDGGQRAEDVNVNNAGRTVDGEETSLQRTAGLDETTGVNGAAIIEAEDNNGASMASMDQSYMLLAWKGDRYQEWEEGTALFSLQGYEGTAILTNNIESDFINDNYHFLGEAMR